MVPSAPLSRSAAGCRGFFAQFFAAINAAADALDAFKDTTTAASKQLQGVPDFFKLGEAEFAARDIGPPGPGPGDGAQLPPFVPDPGRRFPDTPVPVPSFSVGTQRSGLLPSTATVNVTAPIIINVNGANKSPSEIAREVRAEFLRTVLSTSGQDDGRLS